MKYNELYEKKQHGSKDFPIQHYYITNAHPQYQMPLHWHREFEIIHVISGRFQLYLNNVAYTLGEGDTAFVGSGILHRGTAEDCVYECLVFDLNMLRRQHGERINVLILPIISNDATVDCYLPAGDGEVISLIKRLLFAAQKQVNYYELAVYGLLFQLFFQLYVEGKIHTAAQNRRIGRQTDTMITLLDWIELHYTERITLRQLSILSGVNEKYLCHLFREFTNDTPISYINRLRIEHACHAMAVNHRTVTEAAYDSGFNDLSYFSRTFKKYKGVTPKKYCTAVQR